MNCNKRECKIQANYKIIYNAGTGKQILTLCNTHYNSDPVFKLNIKQLREIEN